MPPVEPTAMEGDGPINPTVVDQASAWLAKLWSGTATQEVHQACSRWRAAHADHERAWQRLQSLERKFQIVPQSVAKQALRRPTSLSRRRTLKALGGILITGASIQGARQTSAWQRYAADHRTGAGELRTIMLADSTRINLNTASAIDVNFDERHRRVQLRTGEILVATAPDRSAVPRSFMVTTLHGTVRALGTRFTVRQIDDEASQVAVLEGAVLIEPGLGPDRTLRLDAGQQTTFTTRMARTATGVDAASYAWASGSLVVERMRLGAFIHELSRYRSGFVRCDPAVADYLLTGSYVLPDTDRILASITRALPVKTVYRTRYWVTITAR